MGRTTLCSDYGMFDWLIGEVGDNWATIPPRACSICGGIWDSCLVNVEVDCNFLIFRAWRRGWSEMWLHGIVWFLPAGLALFRAGFSLTLFVGGAVMFPAIYELGWHLPTLITPTGSWPWGPEGFEMLGHSIQWGEFLMGVYSWLLIALSVLGGTKQEPEELEEETEDSVLRPFIVWAQDDEPPPYSPSSSWRRNSISSTSSTRIIVNQLTSTQRVVEVLSEAVPLTVPDGQAWAKVARIFLVGFNWLHVLLTTMSVALLGFVIVENKMM